VHLEASAKTKLARGCWRELLYTVSGEGELMCFNYYLAKLYVLRFVALSFVLFGGVY
jgi:hypothetical protein